MVKYTMSPITVILQIIAQLVEKSFFRTHSNPQRLQKSA